MPGDTVGVLLLAVTPALRPALERGEGLPVDVTCYNQMTARHGIAEFAGLEFAGLENGGLENDGVEQEETYILHTMK